MPPLGELQFESNKRETGAVTQASGQLGPQCRLFLSLFRGRKRKKKGKKNSVCSFCVAKTLFGSKQNEGAGAAYGVF